jgi:hypothetical protein
MKLRVFALVTVVFAALGSVSSHAAVFVSVGVAPPPLVVYEPPPVPFAGSIWTPGYWAWSPVFGYYWVPGVWVRPPGIGLYWTPPWWGFDNGLYGFHDGYWGPSVGFYGGINYGYGYFGNGYWGGRWNGNVFSYNTAVVRVNRNVVTNTFVDRSVLRNQARTTRASFNGPGGVKAQATAEQKAAAENAQKAGPTSEQLARREAAAKDTKLQAKANKGHPNADAIKAFDKTHGQTHAEPGEGAAAKAETANGGAEHARGAGKGAGPKTETAKGAKAEHATAAPSTNKKSTGAETKNKPTHERGSAQTTAHAGQGRSIEQRGGSGRGTEHRQTAVRSTKTKPHETSSAVNRRPTYAKPSRPETGPGRQAGARQPTGPVRGQPAGEQQGKKKKPAKEDQNGRP